MQFINKRHLDIPTKKLSLALFGLSLILLVVSLVGGTESTEPAQPSTTPHGLALGKLETLLLRSAPEDYAAALDAWRESLEPTSLAGVVIEGPRGEVIASSGSFLDQNGRYYSTATSRDERRDLVIRETSVTEMSSDFTREPPYPSRLRVYSYADAEGDN